MAMCTQTTAPWGFLEGRNFCAGEQAQALTDQELESRSFPRASFRKVLHFSLKQIALLVVRDSLYHQAQAQVLPYCFVPPAAMTFSEEERDFVRNKSGKKNKTP